MTIYRNGFSIVELMVALLLGSLIAIAAAQLFLVNRQTSNLQQGLASVQDQGRFIFDYVTRDLMQAGHNPAGSTQPFLFLDAAGNCSAPKCGDDATKYDQVAFQVTGGFDCVGNGPYTGLKVYRVADHGLLCDYWKDGVVVANTLVNGVEALQIQYGIDYDKFGTAGYGQADVYTNSDGARKVLNADSKKHIVSVRFAVLLSSTEVASTETEFASDTVDVLDRTYTSGTGPSTVDLKDGRLYRVFSSTIAVRNQVDPI